MLDRKKTDNNDFCVVIFLYLQILCVTMRHSDDSYQIFLHMGFYRSISLQSINQKTGI